MTAEIAILNKYGVALAADSAVTISTGSKEEKIFNSADKLFELTAKNPIAVMIYSNLQFADIPLQILIQKFRNECPSFDSVKDAGTAFLKFLSSYAASAPEYVRKNVVVQMLNPVLDTIKKRADKNFYEKLTKIETDKINPDSIRDLQFSEISAAIAIFERILSDSVDASFVGEGSFVLDSLEKSIIKLLINDKFTVIDRATRAKLTKLATQVLKKSLKGSLYTGVVVAGFGSKELFPTLVSYEISGFVGGRLKYTEVETVDIDRTGVKARVMPFAQKEMVERFLYGMDERIQRLILKFSSEAVRDISKSILDKLDFEDEAAKIDLDNHAKAAEFAFSEGLKTKAFAEIQRQSQAQIEDMVEFMPKPELAKMAEALVNLTSIKRQVSRGMETVGGPIDVAVISQSDGLVWVKRKHYFPADLNPRYLQRVSMKMQSREELFDASRQEP